MRHSYHEISDERLTELKEVFRKDGIEYETDGEYRDAAQNLFGLFDVLIKMDMEERGRKKRLEGEPKGFAMAGEGRNCSLCGRGVCEGDGWYDKWGFKCLNCQKAVDKKIIPGSMCGDWDHKKCITDSTLSYTTGLHIQTIRKLIRNGKIKAARFLTGLG